MLAFSLDHNVVHITKHQDSQPTAIIVPSANVELFGGKGGSQ